MTYTPSTKFYLADKAAGTPWLTRLAVPGPRRREARARRCDLEQPPGLDVHIPSRLLRRRRARVSRDLRAWNGPTRRVFTLGPDTSEFQPPTLTKTWFHTGAWLEKEALEKALANEYFQQGPASMLLPDTILTGALTIQDEREAARALRGRMLHQEVYALDAGVVGAEKATHRSPSPSRASKCGFSRRARGAPWGVLRFRPREVIAIHTERNPTDPRVPARLHPGGRRLRQRHAQGHDRLRAGGDGPDGAARAAAALGDVGSDELHQPPGCERRSGGVLPARPAVRDDQLSS